jgi:hypothetical protein
MLYQSGNPKAKWLMGFRDGWLDIIKGSDTNLSSAFIFLRLTVYMKVSQYDRFALKKDKN